MLSSSRVLAFVIGVFEGVVVVVVVVVVIVVAVVIVIALLVAVAVGSTSTTGHIRERTIIPIAH
jgi:hypothetical protein